MGSQNRNFSGDFLIPSFHENTRLCNEILVKDAHSNRFRPLQDSNSGGTCNHSDSACRYVNQRCKTNRLTRNIIDDKGVANVRSRTMPNVEEEKTFRNEMYSNDHVTDSLKENYVCLNFEFNQLQERHREYVGNTKSKNNSEDEAVVHSDSSENPLERKYTQVFHHPETPDEQRRRKSSKKPKSQQREESRTENKENIHISQSENKELKLILKTLKKVFKSSPETSQDKGELKKLYEIVKTLQIEQEKLRTVMREQQEQLNNFQSKYLRAQEVIQSQKYDMKQLHNSNVQLEKELNKNINALRDKLQDKHDEVSLLSRTVKSEKAKSDKLSKENCTLATKLQQVKQELALVRAKLEDAGEKRTKIVNKLKVAERDLKIFRTQNNVLKTEKRNFLEELRKLKSLNDDLKTTSSKNISRQKERGETQLKLLRKKIIDLELELNRSQKSTTALVEERDKLIAELHMQLNTLVHNFEVSQKHIRILRRHIHSLSGNQDVPQKTS